jgi:hypothetical protein
MVKALGSEIRVLRRIMGAGSLRAGAGAGVDVVAVAVAVAAAPAMALGYAILATPRIGSTMVRSWLIS